jgi:hypothetical protein
MHYIVRLYIDLSHRRQTPSSNSGNVHEEETAQIEHVLQHHRQLQEELTGDLSKMAAQLKSNSLAFGDLLEKDDQVRWSCYHIINMRSIYLYLLFHCCFVP